jgi:hypothetical protein
MRTRTACALALGLTLLPAAAHAWSQKMLISAVVHRHEFDQVELTNQGCSLTVVLRFDAPESAYDAKEAARNYYRFRARLDFPDYDVETVIFSNDRPGRRNIRYVHDTSGQGCWAKQSPKLGGVRVEGCRRKNCKVPEFD